MNDSYACFNITADVVYTGIDFVSRKKDDDSSLFRAAAIFQLSRLAGLGYGLGLGFWVVITIIVSLTLTLTLIITLTVILP